MKISISETREENTFAVALVEAPPAPNKKPYKDGVHRVVVAASDLSGEWILVNLTPREREMIESALLEMEAPSDTWLWCQLWGNAEAKMEYIYASTRLSGITRLNKGDCYS